MSDELTLRETRLHKLQRMRDLVLRAYEGPMTIDVLKQPHGKLRPVGKVKRRPRPLQSSRTGPAVPV